jgi:outer membrane protein assembly factor BamB
MRKQILLCSVALALALSGCSYMPSWLGGAKKKQEKLPGERLAVIVEDSHLKPDATIAALAFRAPEARQNNDWQQHSGNVSAITANLSAAGHFENKQSARAGDGNGFTAKLSLQPVVADGMVFVMDAAGYVSAHDAAHVGSVKWVSPGASEEDQDDGFGGGIAYDGGVIYAVSGRGIAVAINAQTGQMVWRKPLNLPFRSAPRVKDGRVFATTLDNQLYVLQAATGDVLWTHRGISETTDMVNTVSPAFFNELVIVPYSSGELYALSAADGRELWREAVQPGIGLQSSVSFSSIGGDPVIDGEVIFAVSSAGQLTVYHGGTGQRVWEGQVGSTNTPWISGDYLYVLTSDNTLVAMLKYSGKVRWATRLADYEDPEAKEGLIIWKGPVMVNGTLVVTGSHGGMVRVDAGDGTVLGTQDIPSSVYAAPVVAGGRMYLSSQDATLYSLE